MPYNITITAGEMHVTMDNGDTAAFNLNNEVSVIPHRYRTFNQTPVTPPTVSLTTAITISTDYSVMLHFNDNSELRIEMGTVDNQPTWVNTQAGMNIAILAIQAGFA